MRKKKMCSWLGKEEESENGGTHGFLIWGEMIFFSIWGENGRDSLWV